MAPGRVKRSPLRKRQPTLATVGGPPTERPLKIGATAKLVGVEPYVLRFWETQFPFLRPKQSRSRHRSYSQADIDTLKIIKRLLHTEGYTIAGARKFIREKGLDFLRGRATPSERAGTANLPNERLDVAVKGSSPKGTAESGRLQVNGNVHRMLREIREDLRSLQKLLDSR